MTAEPLAIVFQRRASLEAEMIDGWWRANRASAPELFLLELERMLQVVAILPELGTPASHRRLEGIRRILLTQTGHYIYYRRAVDEIQVLAFGHTSRGQDPGL